MTVIYTDEGRRKRGLALGKIGMGCDLRFEGGISLMLMASYGRSISYDWELSFVLTAS